MTALICLLLNLGASLFKPKSRLEAENAALRHQLAVLQRKVRGRVRLTNSDRLFFIQLYLVSVGPQGHHLIRPETLVRWHRAGFRHYWRWKSRNLGGRPQIGADLRALIQRMSAENSLWGAPRIHGELLKLGFAVAQSTVAKYMTKKGDPSGQSWGTFLRNHMPQIAAMDLFVVPTISFDLLHVLVIVRLARRELVWINVTTHPTAEWIAQQIDRAGFFWHPSEQFYTDATRHSDLDLSPALLSYGREFIMSMHQYMPAPAVLADSWTLFCPECAQKMRIIMVAPAQDGKETRTFECVYGHREWMTVALH